MPHHTIEELIFHMPAIARGKGDEWVKGFAASIMKQSKWRNWKPSPKQAEIMRRLVSELFTETDEMELIEE